MPSNVELLKEMQRSPFLVNVIGEWRMGHEGAATTGDKQLQKELAELLQLLQPGLNASETTSVLNEAGGKELLGKLMLEICIDQKDAAWSASRHHDKMGKAADAYEALFHCLQKAKERSRHHVEQEELNKMWQAMVAEPLLRAMFASAMRAAGLVPSSRKGGSSTRASSIPPSSTSSPHSAGVSDEAAAATTPAAGPVGDGQPACTPQEGGSGSEAAQPATEESLLIQQEVQAKLQSLGSASEQNDFVVRTFNQFLPYGHVNVTVEQDQGPASWKVTIDDQGEHSLAFWNLRGSQTKAKRCARLMWLVQVRPESRTKLQLAA